MPGIYSIFLCIDYSIDTAHEVDSWPLSLNRNAFSTNFIFNHHYDIGLHEFFILCCYIFEWCFIPTQVVVGLTKFPSSVIFQVKCSEIQKVRLLLTHSRKTVYDEDYAVMNRRLGYVCTFNVSDPLRLLFISSHGSIKLNYSFWGWIRTLTIV